MVAELRAAAGFGVWKTADDSSGTTMLVPGRLPPGLDGGALSFNPPRGRLTSDNIDPETEEPVPSEVPMVYNYGGTIGGDGEDGYVLDISVREISDERRDESIESHRSSGDREVALGVDGITAWVHSDADVCPGPEDYHDAGVLSWYDGNIAVSIQVFRTVACDGDPLTVAGVIEVAEHMVGCSFENNECSRRYPNRQ